MGRRTAAAEKRHEKARRVKRMHAKPYYPALTSLDDLRAREAQLVQAQHFRPLTITLADEIELEPRTMRGQLRAKLRVLAYATWWTGLAASMIGIPWGGIRCVLAVASCALVLVLLHRAMPRR
jgi:hypothetical protein